MQACRHGRTPCRMDMVAKASRPSAGQRALAEAIVRGERPPEHGVTELDASVYIDPLRFEREQRRIFDKLPLLLTPSALLPDNNTAIAHDGSSDACDCTGQ